MKLLNRSKSTSIKLRLITILFVVAQLLTSSQFLFSLEKVEAANNLPTKIMTIGDSITADNPWFMPNASGAWRKPLYNSLISSGYSDITFVGSQNRDLAGSVPVQLQGHEAYGGWTSCDFFNDTVYPDRVAFRSSSTGAGSQFQPMTWSITDSLSQQSPDVVVIYIGTNEFINKWWRLRDSTSLVQCEDYSVSMARLFDAAVNAPSQPQVVIGTLGAKGSADDPLRKSVQDEINAVIRNYVSSRVDLGKKVCLAEVAGVYTEPDSQNVLFQDAFHPTAAGKAVIANAFLEPTKRAVDRSCGSAPAVDTTAPKVSISSPLGSSTISGASVGVTVQSSDNVGVTRVELLLNGALRDTKNAPVSAQTSFNLDTTSLPNGSHTLQARAYDAAGNISLTPITTVNVNNVVTVPGERLYAASVVPPNSLSIGPAYAVSTAQRVTFSCSAVYRAFGGFGPAPTQELTPFLLGEATVLWLEQPLTQALQAGLT